MAAAGVLHANGDLKSPNDFLPGTTVPEKTETSPNADQIKEPLVFAGPEVNGKPTTVTLFTPTQLAQSPLVPSLYEIINEAYDVGHVLNGEILLKGKRLRYDTQLFEELGNAPGTFTYIISYAGTQDVVATASGKRYKGRVHVVEKDMNDETRQARTWTRFGQVPKGTVAWELSTLAVDPKLHRQGLAGYLMKLVEDEIKRYFGIVVREAQGDERLTRLVMMITTVKEKNFDFYSRRGYASDYETKYEAGWFESEKGFTVVNMSRSVELGEREEESNSKT